MIGLPLRLGTDLSKVTGVDVSAALVGRVRIRFGTFVETEGGRSGRIELRPPGIPESAFLIEDRSRRIALDLSGGDGWAVDDATLEALAQAAVLVPTTEAEIRSLLPGNAAHVGAVARAVANCVRANPRRLPVPTPSVHLAVFDTASDVEWLLVGLEHGDPPDRIAGWSRTRIPGEDARLWVTSGLDPGVADSWHDNGVGRFSSAEVRQFLVDRIDPEAVEDWAQADVGRFSPADVLEFIGRRVKVESMTEWAHADVGRFGLAEIRQFVIDGVAPASVTGWAHADGEPMPFENIREFVVTGIAPEDVAEWAEAGVRPEDVVAWESAGLSPESAHDWIAAGFDEPGTVVKWERAGFSPQGATAWIDVGVTTPTIAVDMRLLDASPQDAAGLLQAYRPFTTGRWLTLDRSSELWKHRFEWYRHGFDPKTAANWLEARTDPESAAEFAAMPKLLRSTVAEWTSKGATGRDALELVRSGMTSKEITDWLRRFTTAEEILAWKSVRVTPLEAERWARSGFTILESSSATATHSAAVWINQEFTVTQADEWIEAGFSDPEVAADLRTRLSASSASQITRARSHARAVGGVVGRAVAQRPAVALRRGDFRAEPGWLDVVIDPGRTVAGMDEAPPVEPRTCSTAIRPGGHSRRGRASRPSRHRRRWAARRCPLRYRPH